MLLHPDPIAQERSAGQRARRVNNDHPGSLRVGAEGPNEPIHERALSGSGWAGNPDYVRTIAPFPALALSIDQLADLAS
jgi:hypothetical protein